MCLTWGARRDTPKLAVRVQLSQFMRVAQAGPSVLPPELQAAQPLPMGVVRVKPSTAAAQVLRLVAAAAAAPLRAVGRALAALQAMAAPLLAAASALVE